MLNGVAPIIIFNFLADPKAVVFGPATAPTIQDKLSGIPVIGDFIGQIGTPIPIYLDENVSGIYVDNEAKALDIDTEVQVRYDGKPPDVSQRGLTNLITVNLLANRSSIMLSVLLALNDMVFSRVVAKNYNVSYLNGTTTVFNGLLHGFSTSTGSDDDLIRIVLQISKANQSKPIPANLNFIVPKLTGATPVVAGP